MRYRVLVLAEDCNPEWPSLPVVGYKYARALAQIADVTIVTHVRNKPNIDKAGELSDRVVYIDNEWIARPMYRAATVLRGGSDVAWSTNQIMAYLPYLAFERQTYRRFRTKLRDGDFDVVHRITPMSPTLPSYMAGRTSQPFVLGPLNGNLEWPAAFREEQAREREGMRRLRNLYRYLPYARGSVSNASAILAAFEHTVRDLPASASHRTVLFPEIGFDEEIFNSHGRQKPLSGPGPHRFLFAGRLVPYKVPEAAVRAFATSPRFAGHYLHIVGEGPEKPRLEKIAADAGASDRIIFEGRKSQAEVAQFMRDCDVFVFPSIRELGAGVVIEAMASGLVCLVTNYGAPGDLVAQGRGVRIPLEPLEQLVGSYRTAMERCLDQPDEHAELAKNAETYALGNFNWTAKAAYTEKVYDAVSSNGSLEGLTHYT